MFEQVYTVHGEEIGVKKKCFVSMTQSPDPALLSLDGCKSVCGNGGSFWPRPRQISTIHRSLTDIWIDQENSFDVDVSGNNGESAAEVRRYAAAAWERLVAAVEGDAPSREWKGEEANRRKGGMKKLKVGFGMGGLYVCQSVLLLK